MLETWRTLGPPGLGAATMPKPRIRSAKGVMYRLAACSTVVLAIRNALERCPSGYVGNATKARAQGEGDFRRPALIRDCAGNVGFQVVSRPSPGDDKDPSRAGALIKLNFSLGSNCDLRHRLALRLECGGEPTFAPERRLCGGDRT